MATKQQPPKRKGQTNIQLDPDIEEAVRFEAAIRGRNVTRGQIISERLRRDYKKYPQSFSGVPDMIKVIPASV